MSRNLEAIAYHGWGFDQSCWSDWKDLFARRKIHLETFDRGYFGLAQSPVFTEDCDQILLTHSYGLHLCPIEQLRQTKLLVIISSFIDFHLHHERDKRRSQRVLQQMIQDCRQYPETVLTNFKIRCDSLLANPISSGLNIDLLVEDLQDLSVSCLNTQDLKQVPHILILHGAADRIVPCLKGQEMLENLQNHATSSEINYFEIEGAGHALPFSHSKECWQIVSSYLDRIAKNA